MSEEYQPLKWQIVVDERGFESIHETNEDGGPGDLVAEMFGDHAPLVNAAPDLLAALIWAEAAIAPFSRDPAEKSGIKMVRAAIARATGGVK